MRKEELDMLYHLLRAASNYPSSAEDNLPECVYGLCNHLLAGEGGDYHALIRYSSYYGVHFLLEPTSKALVEVGWKFNRIVELGAGFGWLGKGLALKQDHYVPSISVDKRLWASTDVMADLETDRGMELVLEVLKPDDLIVMSEFLHCLTDPRAVVSRLNKWPLLVLEYCSINHSYRESYETQTARYGANPLGPEEYETMFTSRSMSIVDLDPFILLLVDKEK